MGGRWAGAHRLRWCNEIYLTIVVRQNKMVIWYDWYDKSSLQQRPQVCLTGCCTCQNKRDTDDLRPLRRCVELCCMFLQRPLLSCILSLGLTGGYKRNGMEYGERNQVSTIITLAVHSYWVWPSIKSSYILQGSQDNLIFTNPPTSCFDSTTPSPSIAMDTQSQTVQEQAPLSSELRAYIQAILNQNLNTQRQQYNLECAAHERDFAAETADLRVQIDMLS